MEIPIVNTNTDMDLYCSKLSNYFDSVLTNKTDDCLNKRYTFQSDLVKSASLVKNELFKLNLPKELDANGCDEEVEVNDKLLESIKTFCDLLNDRSIRLYIFSPLDAVIPHTDIEDLYVGPHRIKNIDIEDLCVGPHRIKKQDILKFSNFVHKISRYTIEMLDSTAEALQGMDKPLFALCLYSGYLNHLYEIQSSLVESVNLMEDELSQLKSIKASDALWYSCEEVEVTDKLFESIKRFKKTFTYRLIGDYILFSYDQPEWLRSLDWSRGNYGAKGIGTLIDFYNTRSCNPNVLELDIFISFKRVFTHLFCRGDSYVGPYRLRKRDMLRFRDSVCNLSQCANERLSSIREALQIVHLQNHMKHVSK